MRTENEDGRFWIEKIQFEVQMVSMSFISFIHSFIHFLLYVYNAFPFFMAVVRSLIFDDKICVMALVNSYPPAILVGM